MGQVIIGGTSFKICIEKKWRRKTRSSAVQIDELMKKKTQAAAKKTFPCLFTSVESRVHEQSSRYQFQFPVEKSSSACQVTLPHLPPFPVCSTMFSFPYSAIYVPLLEDWGLMSWMSFATHFALISFYHPFPSRRGGLFDDVQSQSAGIWASEHIISSAAKTFSILRYLMAFWRRIAETFLSSILPFFLPFLVCLIHGNLHFRCPG